MSNEKKAEKLLIIDDSSLERDANYSYTKRENEEEDCSEPIKYEDDKKGITNG
jgi:hypothetical protein